jgi:flagellar biosynthesis protein FlhG
MHSKREMDQAEGLRRLLVPNRTQVITVVSGKQGVGSTSVTLNLAAALARSGKDVLVLDENHAPNNLYDRLGLTAGHDLLDVARGKCAPDEAVLVANGYSVMSAARAMPALGKLRQTEQKRLADALAEMGSGVDVILVDATTLFGQSAPSTVSSSLASGGSLLVVADATASGITESYALIKRLALESARTQFGVVVNRAVDTQAAKTAFENMAQVARLNLAAQLDCLGYIPQDDKLKRATQLRRAVVEAFPAGASTKAYLELAQRVLCLPLQHGEAGGSSAHDIIRGLVRSLRQCSGEMAHVVN